MNVNNWRPCCVCSQCQLCIKLRWNMESLHGWWRGRRSTSSIFTENWEHTRLSWRFHFHAGTSVPPVPIHSSYFIFTVLCRAHFSACISTACSWIWTHSLLTKLYFISLSAVTRWRGTYRWGVRWARSQNSPEEAMANWTEEFPVEG